MSKLSFKEVVMPTLTLFVICFIAAAALGVTNFATADKIAENVAAAQQQAMQTVLPADEYVKAAAQSESAELYTARRDGSMVGYVASAVQQGYGGDISVMVGIDINGAVTSIEIVTADDETPGLGQRVREDEFKSRFIGVKSSADSVSVITGASISSRAVRDAVNEGLALYAKEAGIDG